MAFVDSTGVFFGLVTLETRGLLCRNRTVLIENVSVLHNTSNVQTWRKRLIGYAAGSRGTFPIF